MWFATSCEPSSFVSKMSTSATVYLQVVGANSRDWVTVGRQHNPRPQFEGGQEWRRLLPFANDGTGASKQFVSHAGEPAAQNHPIDVECQNEHPHCSSDTMHQAPTNLHSLRVPRSRSCEDV